MKIILLQDEKKLGKKDDIINASDGYARNYILPKGIGVEATAANINDLKLQKANEKKIADEKLAEAQALSEKLGSLSVKTSIKTGAGGRSFGSVSSKEIAEECAKQHGITLDKKKIVLDEAIKAPGTYNVQVKLHPQVTATLSVKVEEA
ncbi:MAG: 50S ribosomal protein L9 [Lachnospiraceae bacterium]|nr:50S ribosomal protein L9 [Lachnospiraceae bacterium]